MELNFIEKLGCKTAIEHKSSHKESKIKCLGYLENGGISSSLRRPQRQLHLNYIGFRYVEEMGISSVRYGKILMRNDLEG